MNTGRASKKEKDEGRRRKDKHKKNFHCDIKTTKNPGKKIEGM